MKKTCATCGTGFEVTPKDSAFYAELKLPSPQSCPDCRSLLRCSHRNERSLSKRTCSLCRKEIVAMYTADAPFPVYCHDCFFSDRWNPLDFGRPYREDVPFFGQLKELLNRVPRLSIINKQTENSEYSNYSYANKNCYLTFGSHYEEDCLYGAYSTKNKDCVDCLWSYGSELLYESLFSKNCNRSIFLDHCADCSDCAFSIDLKGCAYCCFCSNMNHKKYCMFNEQLTKEEYGRRLAALRLETGSGLKEAGRIFSEEMPKRFPVRAFYQIQSEDCEG
ncbi:MAG: hypothetical protein PHE68_03805, partial [Candidatus Peribacteraceae bacterium]|nr:hypothetical protein [Candidatus Peribacteraceae bacterium]